MVSAECVACVELTENGHLHAVIASIACLLFCLFVSCLFVFCLFFCFLVFFLSFVLSSCLVIPDTPSTSVGTAS